MAGVFQMTARHGLASGLGRLDMFSPDVHLRNSRPGGPPALFVFLISSKIEEFVGLSQRILITPLQPFTR
jgi:hypothetical protein